MKNLSPTYIIGIVAILIIYLFPPSCSQMGKNNASDDSQRWKYNENVFYPKIFYDIYDTSSGRIPFKARGEHIWDVLENAKPIELINVMEFDYQDYQGDLGNLKRVEPQAVSPTQIAAYLAKLLKQQPNFEPGGKLIVDNSGINTFYVMLKSKVVKVVLRHEKGVEDYWYLVADSPDYWEVNGGKQIERRFFPKTK